MAGFMLGARLSGAPLWVQPPSPNAAMPDPLALRARAQAAPPEAHAAIALLDA